MSIVNGLEEYLTAPEERNVAEATQRFQHFAPPELLVFGFLSYL